MNKRIVILLHELALVILMWGQSAILPYALPTPQGSELVKPADVPVSYQSGSWSTSIPLYTIKVRDTELPITLDYDGSSLQMNVLPGWTGHGWTLHAGGAITRTVHGFPDEFILPSHVNMNIRFKNYFESHAKMSGYYSMHDGFSSFAQDLKDSLMYVCNDLEPDVFSFSFMGHHGRFFLGNDGQWKVLSNDNIEVLFDVSNYQENLMDPLFCTYGPNVSVFQKPAKVIKGFILRDDKGYEYEFGGVRDAVDFTVDFLDASDYSNFRFWEPTSWYLTEVRDRHGNICFKLRYERGEFIAQFYHANEVTTLDETTSGFLGISRSGLLQNSSSFPYGAQLSSPVYLSAITGDNGISVQFTMTNKNTHATSISDSTRVLDGRRLYQLDHPQNSVLQKDADMRHGDASVLRNGHANMYLWLRKKVGSGNLQKPFYYLQQTDTATEEGRLINHCQLVNGKLDSDGFPDIFASTGIRQLRAMSVLNRAAMTGDTIMFRFRYSYDSRMHLIGVTRTSCDTAGVHRTAGWAMDYNRFDSVPADYLTLEYDHWGHYNANSMSCSSLEPVLHSLRNPSPTHGSFGLLSKITYPTGAVSVIGYEPNTFSHCRSADRQCVSDTTGYGGGVRVCSVTEYEDSTCETTLKSRTFHYGNPVSGDTTSGTLFAAPVYRWSWIPSTNAGHNIEIVVNRDVSILPLSNSSMPGVTYSFVTEQFADGSKIVRKFSDFGSTSPDLLEHYAAINSYGPSPYDIFGEKDYLRGRLLEENYYNCSGALKRKNLYEYDGENDYQYVLASNVATNNNAYFIGRIYKLFYPKYNLCVARGIDYQNESPMEPRVRQNIWLNRNLTILHPYIHSVDVRCLDKDIISCGGNQLETKYLYTFNDGNPLTDSLAMRQHELSETGRCHIWNGQLTDSTCTRYAEFLVAGQPKIMPCFEVVKRGSGGVDTLRTYLSYSPELRLSAYQDMGKPPTQLIWVYNGCYLAAVIEGSSNESYPLAHTSRDIFSITNTINMAMGYVCQHWNSTKLRAFSYNPFWGASASFEPNGIVNYYDYDENGFLNRERDAHGAAMRHYMYNYRNK